MNSVNDAILVGDIGGTNTRLAIAYREFDTFRIDHYEKFLGDHYNSLDEILQTYLQRHHPLPTLASLAVAGPIYDGKVNLTNRNWTLSVTSLKQKFNFDTVALHNDFAAMSRSVLIMDDDSFDVFYDNQTDDKQAPILVAGPGTGFGMGVVLQSLSPPYVMPSEGGHQAYAPQTELECALLHTLQKKFDFVSLELVCSGRGMDDVHEALCQIYNRSYRRLLPATIRERAEAGDVVCQKVCEIRAAAVMGAVGDIALACGTQGGVVLAGGVSERLSDYLRAPQAMERFFNRGPRLDYVRRLSVRLLTHPKAPLYGAAALFGDHHG